MEKYTKLDLTPRLQLLANWVPNGAKVADIGTDHAYLPTWLILHGRASAAIGGDLRPGPLSRARQTTHTYGVAEKVDLRLCNGLSGIAAEEADTIVIAGMGGENIAAILQAAPWTADGAHTLLLQPMTRAEVLREFLSCNGYRIEREQLVLDRGTLYPVILARGGELPLTLGQFYGGAALMRDPLGNQYLIDQIIRCQSAVAGLNRSAVPTDQKKADYLRDVITALLEMREEWRHANCETT